MGHALAPKPTSRLNYWSGGSPSRSKAAGFKIILLYCVGPPDRDPRPRCWHNARLKVDDLPERDWYDICAHLNARNVVALDGLMRPNWSEVINFNKGVS